ncbi:50S ribosomal protein L14 [Blattabacterium cuenoti]
MLQQESICKVSDNTGAKEALVIRVLGGSKKRYALLADSIIVTIKSAIPGNNSIKKGQISKAVIIRIKNRTRRKDGSYISFDDNACVLINPSGEMIGSRVFGPVARELREKKYMKIISLAQEVL